MKTTCVFIGGPLHRQKMEMSWIPQLNLCIDERDRQIHAYVRDELAYFYERELSRKLTENYDVVRQRWRGKPNPMKPLGDA